MNLNGRERYQESQRPYPVSATHQNIRNVVEEPVKACSGRFMRGRETLDFTRDGQDRSVAPRGAGNLDADWQVVPSLPGNRDRRPLNEVEQRREQIPIEPIARCSRSF
jgi:hypothetical protein